MKNDLTCGVVRDLLPSYVEGMTSDETNAAVEAHLAACPDSAARRDAMTSPAEPAEAAEQSREVDYLKTVKRKSGRRVVIAIVCTVLLILAGFALKIFVIGSPAQKGELIASGFTEENGVLRLSVTTPYSATAYRGWTVDISDGVANIAARSVLVSPLFPDGGGTVEVPLDGVEEVRLCGRVVWQDGVAIQHETARLYETRTPYVGDMPALNRVANALDIQGSLGPYTNSLHTSSRPYDWTLELANPRAVIAQFESSMNAVAIPLLALVDNLDQVTFAYTDVEGQSYQYTVTKEDAIEILQARMETLEEIGWKTEELGLTLLDSVKDYAASPAEFQRLYQFVTTKL